MFNVNGQTATMKQDPDSGSNGKIFTTTLSLPAGNNTVSVVAEDLSTIGNPPGPLNGGNLTTKNYSVTVVGGQDKTFKYDSNGNLTNSVAGTTTNDYQWDAENRLVKITQSSPGNPTLESDFTYDGFSRLVEVMESENKAITDTKRFVWYGKQMAEERDANNTVVKRFFPEGERYGIANYYFTKDHLGNIREIVDSSGTIRARYDYDPYGRRTKVSGDLEADFGFTGYYVHQPSGLQLALYRAYDADTGRWINRDPIGEMGGLNLYDYVANNPINRIDPLGLWGIAFGNNSGSSYFNIGWGNPSLYFSPSSFNDAGQGLAAAADGANPFGNPFASHGFYNPCDPNLKFSKAMGTVAATSLTTAAGLGALRALNGFFMPDTLYHFTSLEGAAEIAADGGIDASGGTYGYGTYLTGFNNATMATLQGASATDVAIPVATEGLEVSPTYFPGTYIVRGAGILLP